MGQLEKIKNDLSSLASIEDVARIKEIMDNIYKEISKNPQPQSVQRNQYNNNAEYLQIGYIEAQLDRLFLSWDWIVNNVQLIANGIVVNGTLTVVTLAGNKISRSGVAGVAIQTVKDATSLTPDNLSRGAMDRDPGRAEAYALKNAASKLGNAFGRSLNRKFKHEHIAHETLTAAVLGMREDKE